MIEIKGEILELVISIAIIFSIVGFIFGVLYCTSKLPK